MAEGTREEEGEPKPLRNPTPPTGSHENIHASGAVGVRVFAVPSVEQRVEEGDGGQGAPYPRSVVK